MDTTFFDTKADRGKKTHQFLNQQQIEMIDEALSSLGEFGEVRLVVEKGRLRFLVTQKSFDALKFQPGVIHGGNGE